MSGTARPLAALATALLLAAIPACSPSTNRGLRKAAPAVGSTAIMCAPEEPGPRLLIDGIVLDEQGRPVPGATVGAYNTDQAGLYNPPEATQTLPRIRAAVVTDPQGRFQLLTVRPAPYPGGTDPAHVHFDATAPMFLQSFRTIWFEGDPLITSQRREWAQTDQETDIVTVDDRDGLQVVRVQIRLRAS